MADYASMDPYGPNGPYAQYGGGNAYGGNPQFRQGAYDPTYLPQFAPDPPGAISAGLAAGYNSFKGGLGSAADMLGTAIGSDSLQKYGQGVAKANAAKIESGRPDLEKLPWEEGGAGLAGLPGYLGYQAAKLATPIGLTIAGAVAAPFVAPEAAAVGLGATALSRFGMMIPGALGGARAAAAAGDLAAPALGRAFALRTAGGTAALYPSSAGQLFQNARDREAAGGEKADGGDALKAMALGVPYSALGTMEVSALGKIAKAGEGGAIQKIATHAADSGIAQMGLAATQAAVDQSFRSDLTIGERANNVVNAALAGGVLGGVLGAGGGAISALRKVKTKAPGEVSVDDINSVIDAAFKKPGEMPPGLPNLPDVIRQPPRPEPNFTMVNPQMGTDLVTTPPGPSFREVPPDAPPAQVGAAPRPLAIEPPPKPPANIEQIFKGVDDDTITRLRTQLETNVASGNLEPTGKTNLQLSLLRAEEARRAEGRAAEPTSTGGLFSERDFDQSKPEPTPAAPSADDAERATRVKAMVDETQKIAGGSAPWIKKLDVEDKTGLLDVVQKRLEDGATDKKTENLAKHFGILDDEGNVRDHAAELEADRAALDRAQTQAITDPSARAEVQAISDRIAKTEQTKAVLDDAQQRRAGGPAAEQRVQPETSPPASTAAPAPTPQLDFTFKPEQLATDTAGRAVSEPVRAPEPQTFGQTRDALAGIVGKANSVTKNIDARNLPEAINAVADHLEQKKRPNQTMMKIAQHFGLMEGGKPVALPDAVERTTQKLAAVKAEINSLPPENARASRVLAPRAAELQGKLDHLQAALEQRTRSTDVTRGESIPTPDKSVSRSLVDRENENTQLAARRAQLADIAEDKTVDPGLRRAARDAEMKIREGAHDAADSADHVLAAHEAITGNKVADSRGSLVDDFSRNTAHEIDGDVVHKTDSTALVRKVMPDGSTRFVGVKKTPDGTVQTHIDVDRFNGPAFTGRELSELRAAKADFMAADKAAAQDRPEGPFQGAKANVVASANVDPRLTGLLHDTMQNLGLGNVKVFLFHPEDVRGEAGKYGLAGDHAPALGSSLDGKEGEAGTFGRNGNQFFIALKPGMSDALSIETLAHEVGHVVEWTALQNATPAEKAAIDADFAKWQKATSNMTAQEITRALRNKTIGEAHAPSADAVAAADPKHTAYLRSKSEYIADQVGKAITGDLKGTGAVAKFFGKLADLYKSLMTSLGLSKGGIDPGMRDFLKNLSEDRPLAWNENASTGMNKSAALRGGDRVAGLDPRRMDEGTRFGMGIVERISNHLETMNLSQLKTDTFHVIRQALSAQALERAFGSRLPGIKEWIEGHEYGHAARAKWAGLWRAVDAPFRRADEKIQILTQQLMKFSPLQIDPSRTPEEHTWLKDKANFKSFLTGKILEANKLHNDLARLQGSDIYNGLRDYNRAMLLNQNTTMLVRAIRADELYAQKIGVTRDPLREFINNPALNENVAASIAHYDQAYKEISKKIADFVGSETARADALPAAEKNAVLNRISTLTDLHRMSMRSVDNMKNAPYFHVGRFGDHMATFDIKRLANGDFDPAALKAVQDKFEKAGITEYELEQASRDRPVFIRLETASQAAKIRELAFQLKDEGHVIGDPAAGPRGGPEVTRQASPEVLQQLLNTIEANYKDEKTGDAKTDAALAEQKSKVLGLARQAFFELLPDNAMLKVLSKREGNAGYDQDMMRNFARRAEIGITAVGNGATGELTSRAFANMARTLREAKSDRNISTYDVARMHLAVEELAIRDKNRSMVVGHNMIDVMRSATHTYFLGLSPSYVGVNMSQIGTMTLPVLGSKYGYTKSAQAIARVTPIALRILKEQIKQGAKQDWRQKAAGTIDESVIKAAGLDAGTAAFIRRAVIDGFVEMGASGRELFGVAQNSAGDNVAAALRYSSSVAVYSETLSKLITALAARELHPQKDSDAAFHYSKDVVDRSMFNYNTWAQSRLLGKGGILGPLGPLATSFATYSHRLIESLYFGVHDAFMDASKSDKEKAEARSFLLGHLAATVVASGALGLPTLAIWTRAAEKIGETISGDETPWDLKASFRNHVNDMFGSKIMGDLISRGALRFTGADFASRLDESEILPFTRLLTDKRKWEDASKDWAFKSMGAPTAMMSDIISGGRDIARGDILKGMKEVLPKAFKGLTDASDMAVHGYHDSTGNKMPLTPTSKDYIATVLGFTPTDKAEYEEGARSYQERRDQLSTRSTWIRNRLATAIEEGDQDRARTLLQTAREFDKANPAQAILPRMDMTMQRRAQARALATSLGGPLGVRPKDLGGRAEAQFGNY